ncbi:MAG: DUF1573 domain-containing protein [Acidobacteriota bacterium]
MSSQSVRFVTLLAVLLVGTAGSATALAENVALPSAVLTSTTHDAGTVDKGQVISHAFRVHNPGAAPLQLEVKPACGCTVPEWDRVVAPGESGTITLKVDTARFKGSISKSATVTTNDPSRPTLKLVVQAEVTSPVDVLPSERLVIRQTEGKAERRELSLRRPDGAPLRVRDVQVSDDALRYELKNTGAAGVDPQLVVWVAESTPPGRVDGKVTLLTDAKDAPEVTVRVRASVVAASEATKVASLK